MLEKIFSLFKFVFTVTDEIKRLQADAKEFDQQLRRLAENQARLYYEVQLQRERDAREHERAQHESAQRALESKVVALESNATALEQENERLRGLLEKPPKKTKE